MSCNLCLPPGLPLVAAVTCITDRSCQQAYRYAAGGFRPILNVHAPENRQQLGRAGAAPLVDDSQGPIDPADLAAGEAESGTQRVSGVADAGDALSALSLGGFCPVSFVKRGGLLAPVDPMVGLIRQVTKWPWWCAC